MDKIQQGFTGAFSTVLGTFGLSIGSLALSNLVSALVIFIICLITVKVLNTMLERLLNRSKLDRTLHAFIKSAVRCVLYVLTGIIVLGSIGFNISSLVAVLSVAGLAVSLAMQRSLSNLAGGILLLVTKPFSVGDYVDAGGESGVITEIGLVYTEICTLDNKRIYIPNSAISGGNIVNYSSEGKRRVDLKVSASYNATVEQVRRAVGKAIQRVPQVLGEPEPFVRLSEYGDSCITYTIRVWCENADYWTVYYDLLEGLKIAFEEERVEMTYNHLNVHVMNDKA